MVIGREIRIEPGMGEEVCGQKQLLGALPPPQVMLPETDPQVPVRIDFRGQAGDGELRSPKVLCASAHPHTLSEALLLAAYFPKSAIFFHIPPEASVVTWVHWNLVDARGPHLPHKNIPAPAPNRSGGLCGSGFKYCQCVYGRGRIWKTSKFSKRP